MAKRKIDAVEDSTTSRPRRTRTTGRVDLDETPSTPKRLPRKPVVEITVSTRSRTESGVPELTTQGKSRLGDEPEPSPSKAVVKRTYGRTPRRVTSTADVKSVASKENRNAARTRRIIGNESDEERRDSSEDELTIHARGEPLQATTPAKQRVIVADNGSPSKITRSAATSKARGRNTKQNAGMAYQASLAPPRTRSGRPTQQSSNQVKERESESEDEVATALQAIQDDTLLSPSKSTRKVKATPATIPRTRSSRRLQIDAEDEQDILPAAPLRKSSRTARSATKPSTSLAQSTTRKRKASEELQPLTFPSQSSSGAQSPIEEIEHETRHDSNDIEMGSPSKRQRGLAPTDAPQTPSRRKRNVAPFTEELQNVEAEDPSPQSPTTRQIDEDDSIFLSPVKGARSVPASPTKGKGSVALPPHLIPCLNAQKRAILRALQKPPLIPCDNDEPELDNAVAYQQLTDLLEGTMKRNEGNSCLLLGPRGSGKTRLIERCLSELDSKPIIIRLSGWVQGNDRLALRQIAVQLAEQTGNTYLSDLNRDEPVHEEQQDEEETSPFLDEDNEVYPGTSITLPPSSHLPALIAMLPTLSRPTIVLVDAFDLFALHPRQALLYCLLDTVQSCQSGKGNKGLAVIGLTTRVDTLQLLEKRVKSRFSGRILRVTSARKDYQWMKILKSIYMVDIPTTSEIDEEELAEWKDLWSSNVERFIADKTAVQIINESTSIVSDMRMMARILTPPIIRLSEKAPFPSTKQLAIASTQQRARPAFPFLHDLSYPSLCLLIASHQSNVGGHPVFTFEMLYEAFKRQLKLSTAAPIQLNGSSIGMVRCSRGVLMSAFEALCSARIFICAAAPSGTTAKEFIKYRSVVEREDLKKAIDKAGQTNLKKWWNKAQ